jgi:hypothetical protein
MQPPAVSFKRRLQSLGLALVTVAAAVLTAAPKAQAAAIVTIVEGEATLVDGARALVATEGLKLGDETLVRTGTSTTLLRVEWPDGTAADFGPDTQAMVEPGGFGKRSGRAPAVYLLRGCTPMKLLVKFNLLYVLVMALGIGVSGYITRNAASGPGPGGSAEQRAAADRQGQRGARLHRRADHQAARDADEVRVPAAVGAQLLGGGGAGHAEDQATPTTSTRKPR